MVAQPSEPYQRAPIRELGFAGFESLGTYWDTITNEVTPELQWPFCIEVYDQMRRQDAQVSSVLRAVTSPILRTPWRVDGTGCRPEVAQWVADDLGLPLVGQDTPLRNGRGRSRFSWQDHLRLALLMLPFGHMFFEQLYTVDPDNGLYHIRKLGPRMHRTIARINVARDGGLVSIEQRQLGGGQGPLPNISDVTGNITLPVGRLVAYVLEREGGNWLGTSLLRPAYKNWILKDRLLRVQTMAVERNGLGIPLYEASSATDEKELAAGEDLAASVRAGDDAGAAIPNGAKLSLMGVTGTLPDADKPIRYHDEQIARAVLAHFLNLGTQTGSWALGSTFADFFTLSLQEVAEQVRDTATLHIVEDLVDANWGPDEIAPRLVFDEIGSDGSNIVGAIASLVQAGVLQPDEDLETFVRGALGLPARGGKLLVPAAPTVHDPGAGDPAPAPASTDTNSTSTQEPPA